MNIETYEDLIEWTTQMHAHLSECLRHCATEQEEARANWLLTYLADHEEALERIVGGFKTQAQPGVLHTWFYDFLEHNPIQRHQSCDKHYASMSFDEICQEIFDIHNQLIELYRNLASRADVPETRELMEQLLQLEEHETMRLARQIGRSRDL